MSEATQFCIVQPDCRVKPAPAEGKWSDIAVLEPVRDYKARHASTMLTFDAVVDAIGQIEKKRGAKDTTKAAAE